MEVERKGVKSFTFDYNPKLGRHLIATRDIEEGEVIIDDYPLALGPSTYVAPSPNIKYSNVPIPVCPTCYRKFSSTATTNGNDRPAEEQFICPKCGLRLCSKVCSEAKVHVENECKIFNRIPSLHIVLKDNVRDLHQFITSIRCLFYRTREPIKWAQIKELQGRVEELREMGVFDKIDQAFSLLTWNHFGDGDGSSEEEVKLLMSESTEVTEDIMNMARHCVGIFRTNAFSRFSSKRSIECLYFLSSFMAHNCLMNTDRSFDMDGIRLVTTAARPILKGQIISTTYLSHLSNNVERQQEMRSVWDFSCDCARCLDPTECGTHLSTIACPSCKSLTLNPHLVTNSCSNHHRWICEDEKCQKVVTDNEIDMHLGRTLWLVENAQPDISDLRETEDWLMKYDIGQFIHSNNSLFLQVKLHLCQEYGKGVGISSLTDGDLLRKKRLCEEVIAVLDKILIGSYMLKGIVLFELWLSLVEIRRRKTAQNPKDEIIRNTATRAKEILRFSRGNSAEEFMYNILVEESDDKN